MSIYSKLVQVLYPRRATGREVLKWVLGYSRPCLWVDSCCRDWDLWGPLLLCLCLGIMLSINVRILKFNALFITHSDPFTFRHHPLSHSAFSQVSSLFAHWVLWLLLSKQRLEIYTLNGHQLFTPFSLAIGWTSVGIILLRINSLNQHFLFRSFFQGLCLLGYCIAPLDIAALISYFVRIIWIRAPIALLAWAWCIWGMCYLTTISPLSNFSIH